MTIVIGYWARQIKDTYKHYNKLNVKTITNHKIIKHIN